MRAVLLASSAFALSLPAATFAQETPVEEDGQDSGASERSAQSDGNAAGVIIVTANRREQNLQDVGASISALTGSDMTALGVNNASDVAEIVPNVEIIRSYAAPGFNTQITIRGVGQPDFQDTTEATATAYVDEFYMIGAGQADFLAYDLERVEVARGPQGTIQGRNATAGSINYVTERPDLSGTDGRASVTIAQFGTVRTNGHVNIPVSENLAVRAAFATNYSDGYFDNINPRPLWRKGGAVKFYSGRLQALYEPSPDVTLLLKAEYGRLGPVAAGNERFRPVGVIPGLTGTYALPADAFGQTLASIGVDDIDETNADGANEVSNEVQHYLGRLEVTASDQLDLVLLGGYLKSDKYSLEDCDHSPLPICNFSNDATSEHWLVEARGLYDLGATQITFGANYLEHGVETISGTPLFFSPAITPFGTTLYGQAFDDRQDLNSFALFGQVEYEIVANLTLIAGLRYTWDDKVLNSTNAFTVNLPLDTPLPTSRQGYRDFAALVFADPSAVFTTLNPELNGDLAVFDKGLLNTSIQLNYEIDPDTLLYASYKRGKKSGGFITGNVAGTAPDLRPFGEETNNAYEIGLKTSLLNRTLQINSALFYYDYQDMQNTSVIGITNVITNNDAEVLGGEVELNARLFDGLEISLSAGYLDTEVENIFNPTGAVPILSDNRLPLAPSFTGSGRIRYNWGQFDGNMFVQAVGSGRTEMFRDSLNNPSTLIPGIFLADLSAGYASYDGIWELSFFVENIFNTRKPINVFDISSVGGSGEAVFSSPRWFGGTLSVGF